MTPTRIRALAWVLLQAALQISLFLGSDNGFTLDEGELNQPTVSWVLTHGYAADFPRLQFGSYAGSAALTPWLAAPLLALIGPRLVAWKILVWVFSGALLLAGRRLAGELGGDTARELFCALLVFAPTFYLDVSVHGIGSHTGVMLPIFLACLALLKVLDSDRVTPALALGLLSGLTVTLAYTGAFAPPVLLLLWLLGRRPTWRQGLAYSGGAVVGLVPWATLWTLQREGRSELPDDQTLAELLSPSHIAERVPLLVDSYAQGMFFGALPSGPGHWIALAQVLAVVAAIALAVRAARDGRPQLARAAMAPALILAYVVAFLLTDPTATMVDTGEVIGANSLRYHAPFVPLAALCIASWLQRVPQRALPALVVLLLGPGLSARMTSIGEPLSLRAAHLPALQLELVHDRMDRPPIQIRQLRKAPITLDELFERTVSDDPWMRRLHWELLGFELGPQLMVVERPAVVGFDEWVHRLDPALWPDLFRGAARETRRDQGKHLDALSEGPRRALERAWYRKDPTPCMTDLYEGVDWDAPRSCEGPEWLWAMGAAMALAPPGSYSTELADVPSAYRAAVAEGMGDAHGRRRGYRDEACPLEQHCDAWQAGFEAGAREVFGD